MNSCAIYGDGELKGAISAQLNRLSVPMSMVQKMPNNSPLA